MENRKDEKAKNLKFEFAKELGAYDIFKYGGWAAAVSSREPEVEDEKSKEIKDK